jgi:GTPase KRas protein
VVVGNKVDLEDHREVPTETGQQFAQSIHASFFETSAKLNTRVQEVFFEVVKLINEWRQAHPEATPSKKKKGTCLIL